MTVYARDRTPAALAARQPQRRPVYTQAEQRDRRREGLTVALDGRWSLTDEVQAICGPLAAQVTAAAPNPAAYWRNVDDLRDAVHQVVHVVVGLLAQADAERRTRHLNIDVRGRSIRALVDLAERPKLPEIADEAVVSGTWAVSLTALAEPYSGRLARLLGNALTTAVSDRVLAALREVDRAALAFERRLDRDERARTTKTKTGSTYADRARAELAALGIHI